MATDVELNDAELSDAPPATRAESPFDTDSGDSDAISLTSTVFSEYDHDAVFPVHKILAERTDDTRGGRKEFLVKWEGWSELSATWEDWSSFNTGQADTVPAWQTQRMKEARTDLAPFKVDAWKERQEQRAVKHWRRHFRRNRKRIRLNQQPTQPLEGDCYDESEGTARSSEIEFAPRETAVAVSSSDDDDDVPLVSPRTPSRRKTAESSDDDAPLISRTKPKVSTPHQSTSVGATMKKSKDTSSTTRAQPQTAQIVRTQKKSTVGQTVPETTSTAATSTFWSTFGSAANAARTSVAAATKQSQQSQAPFAMMMSANNGTSTTKQQHASAALAKMSQKRLGGPSHVFGDVTRTKKRRSGSGGESLKEKQEPGAVFKNLATRNSFKKWSRMEDTPPLESVARINLSTGQVANPAPQQQGSRAVQSPTSDTSRSLARSFTNSARNPAEAPVIRNDRVTSDELNAPVSSSVTSSSWRGPQDGSSNHRGDDRPEPTRTTSRNQATDQLTCWFWHAKQRCNFGADCYFAHHDTGRVAPPYNDVNSSTTKDNLACPYWYEGRCNKRAEDCRYAHAERPHVAAKRGEAEFRLTGQKRPFPADRMTCWYYWFRTCEKSPETCKFAHEPKMYIVGRAREAPIPILDTKRGRAELEKRKEMEEKGAPAPPQAPRPEPARPDSPSPPPRSPRDQQMSGMVLPFASHLPTPSKALTSDMTAATSTDDSMSPVKTAFTFRPGTFGDRDEVKIDVLIRGADENAKKILRRELSKFGVLRLKAICVAESAQRSLENRDATLAAGDVVPSEESKPDFNSLVDCLKLNSAAAVILLQQFTAIVYPSQPIWKFLEPTANSFGDSKLRLSLVTALPTGSLAPVLSAASGDEVGHVKLAGPDQTRNLDAARLFGLSMQAKILSTLLESHYFDAKVFNGWAEGAWATFSETCKSGVIIFPPHFDSYHRIPDLLPKLDRSFNFFKMALEPGPAPSPAAPNANTMQINRIFPHGRAVFIMDDCFQRWPKDTLAVVRFLLERIRTKPPGLTRILGRPGLVAWLRELATAAAHGGEASLFVPDSSTAPPADAAEIFVALDTLLHSDARFTDEQHNPAHEHSPLYFLPVAQAPFYSSIAARDARQAAEYAASWFARWARDNVAEVRKFVILTELDRGVREEWKAKYRHVNVLTPEKYCEEERSAMASAKAAASAGRKK